MLHCLELELQKNVYSLKLRTSNSLVPALQDSYQYIQSLDFSMIAFKLARPDPNIACVWEGQALQKAIEYYKNYLWLLRKYSDDFPIIPPSIEMDEIWHHHILDTYQYQQDCYNIFGQFLHHYPYFGMRGEQDFNHLKSSFEITQKLYFQEFGDYIYSFEGEITECG